MPIAVSLRPDNQLELAPVAELQTLRGKHWRFENLDFDHESDGLLAGVEGDCLEILAEFEPDGHSEFGLKLRSSPYGEEETRVVFQGIQERLVTEADWQHWKPADLQPYIEHVLEVFGPDRVMYGSDSPVAALAATYTQWVETLMVAARSLSNPEQEKVFYQNAARFYRLASR